MVAFIVYCIRNTFPVRKVNDDVIDASLGTFDFSNYEFRSDLHPPCVISQRFMRWSNTHTRATKATRPNVLKAYTDSSADSFNIKNTQDKIILLVIGKRSVDRVDSRLIEVWTARKSGGRLDDDPMKRDIDFFTFARTHVSLLIETTKTRN